MHVPEVRPTILPGPEPRPVRLVLPASWGWRLLATSLPRSLTLARLQTLRRLLSSSLPSLPSLLLTVLCCCLLAPRGVQAQGVELATLQTGRDDGVLTLEFVARVSLPRAVEDALQRGVPIYFVAQAQLLRNRWYWRDERVARVSRSWRLAFQPLTSAWRVSLGGLNQSYASLPEALSAVSRSANWKLADLSQLDADRSYYIEFNYRLDTSQLPGPMQFGLGGQSDWAVGISRTLRVEP